MDRVPGYDREYERGFKEWDKEAITAIDRPILVQVYDILNVQESVSSQLEKLYAKRHNIQLVEEDEAEVPQPSTHFCKYSVRDSRGDALYLIFHTTPLPAPKLGQYLILEKGCKVHRRILVGMPSTVTLLEKVGVISRSKGKISQLEELLAKKSTS